MASVAETFDTTFALSRTYHISAECMYFRVACPETLSQVSQTRHESRPGYVHCQGIVRRLPGTYEYFALGFSCEILSSHGLLPVIISIWKLYPSFNIAFRVNMFAQFRAWKQISFQLCMFKARINYIFSSLYR